MSNCVERSFAASNRERGVPASCRPTGCPNFASMTCGVGDWRAWTFKRGPNSFEQIQLHGAAQRRIERRFMPCAQHHEARLLDVRVSGAGQL